MLSNMGEGTPILMEKNIYNYFYIEMYRRGGHMPPAIRKLILVVIVIAFNTDKLIVLLIVTAYLEN